MAARHHWEEETTKMEAARQLGGIFEVPLEGEGHEDSVDNPRWNWSNLYLPSCHAWPDKETHLEKPMAP